MMMDHKIRPRDIHASSSSANKNNRHWGGVSKREGREHCKLIP